MKIGASGKGGSERYKATVISITNACFVVQAKQSDNCVALLVFNGKSI
jgi:hypothetical protein